MSILGVICGLVAALFMALAFFCSSRAIRLHPDMGSLGLLARAHVIMGGLALVALPLFWREQVWQDLRLWLPITLAGVLCYLLGQTCLFLAQRKVDSSRLVPLLGLKLVILAFLNAIVFRSEQYGWLQVLAIICTLSSALMLNNAGRKIPLPSFFLVILACTGYSLSDTCIKRQMEVVASLGIEGLALQSLLCTSLSYTLSGVLGLLLLPLTSRQGRQSWIHTAPFALTWITGIVFLFACFALIGTVNGNIAQSTRGLWAILAGYILAKAGLTYLEERVSWQIILRRVAAAILMILAILLFNCRQ
ncbi:MAG: DMT family transporter [Oligosphaeraceae bacterium]|nr:DMT family transporter [Oligosphaeraceae bacterium]